MASINFLYHLKCLPADLCDLVVLKIQPPHEPHAPEAVGVQLCDVVLAQVENS